MIYEVNVTNSNGLSQAMSLTNPTSSGFIIKDISGLGPAKANVNLRENVGVSGSVFNSARTASRNIVFTLEFVGYAFNRKGITIEMDRLRTYELFPTESKIMLSFNTDAGWFHIDGFVESNEPDIFSQNEGTVISVICPDPYFRGDGDPIAGDFTNITPLFDFPFSNPQGSETLEMGELDSTMAKYIDYKGTVSVGPTFTLYAVGGPVVNPVISFYNEYFPGDVEQLMFEFTTALPRLENGDVLTISCEKMNKSIERYSIIENKTINYIGALSLNSVFPVLRPGNNIFRYDAESGAEFIRLEYEYPLKYSGI